MNIFDVSAIGSVSVGNTSTEVLPAENQRRYCAITNKGNKDAWINFGAPAVFGQGILLGKQGGFKELLSSAFTSLAVNAITDTGNTDIAFLEGTASS